MNLNSREGRSEKLRIEEAKKPGSEGTLLLQKQQADATGINPGKLKVSI